MRGIFETEVEAIRRMFGSEATQKMIEERFDKKKQWLSTTDLLNEIMN